MSLYNKEIKCSKTIIYVDKTINNIKTLADNNKL